MTKDSYWFRHDANARNDPRMCRLLMLGGQAAKGSFWDMIEILRESENYRVKISELPAIAFACRFPDGAIDHMIECELIRVDDECAWSDSLDRRMGELDKIRKKRAKSGRLGGKAKASKCQADAKQSSSKGVAKPSDLIGSDLIGSDPIGEEKRVRTPKPPRGIKKSQVEKPAEVSDQLWSDFVAHRKSKRAAVTSTAIAGIRNEAKKAGLNLSEALTMCCAQGWQGFKASWVEKSKKTPEIEYD